MEDINELCIRIYPYLACQIMDYYGRGDADVLELAPFAGGVSMELGRLHPGLNIAIGAQDPVVFYYLQKEIEKAKLDLEIALRCSELDSVAFAERL